MDGKHNIQVIILSAVAVAAALIVFSIYGVSARLSREADELTDAVTLCRSVVEIYLSDADFEEAITSRGWRAEASENGITLVTGEFTVQIEAGGEETGAGLLMDVTVTVYNLQGAAVYSLDTAGYFSGIESQKRLH